MPSVRFEKLSAPKKEKIIWTAIEEFSKNGYDEASINSIIKNAGISRGSFYTYFVDKDDIFNYVMEIFADTVIDFIIKTLKEEKGDIIKMMIKLYDVRKDLRNEHPEEVIGLLDTMVERVFTSKRSDLNKNNMKEPFFQSEKGEILMDKLYEHSNKQFNGYSREKFASLIELLFTILFKSIVNESVFSNDEKSTRSKMIEWMAFVRNGMDF